MINHERFTVYDTVQSETRMKYHTFGTGGPKCRWSLFEKRIEVSTTIRVLTLYCIVPEH